MANKQKEKGKRLENLVSKIIKDRFKLTSDEVHRAQSSGTFKSDYSDIFLQPFDYKKPHIIIECKNWNKKYFTYNKFINPVSFISNIEKQITESCVKYKNEYNIYPVSLIIYTTSHAYVLCAIHESDLFSLFKKNNKYNIELNKNINDEISFYIRIIINNKKYYIYIFEEFVSFLNLINK